MSFILAYIREIALGVIIIALLWFGWHYSNLQQLAAENSSLRQQLAQSQKAAPAIMDFTQKFNNEVRNAKDDCLNKPVPAGILKQLR